MKGHAIGIYTCRRKKPPKVPQQMRRARTVQKLIHIRKFVISQIDRFSAVDGFLLSRSFRIFCFALCNAHIMYKSIGLLLISC